MTANIAPLQSVCVFCGTHAGVRSEYLDAARALGAMLARAGITLVFGGGRVGMMGAVSDAALAHGGRVIGVIPTHLVGPEHAHPALTELQVVGSMHERKRRMAEQSDAFVVLPGGYGTLDETFEMLTWLQIGIQSKPVGIVNVAGYFNDLLRFVRHAAAEGFIRPAHWDLLIVEPDAHLLLERLRLHARTLALAHPAGADPARS